MANKTIADNFLYRNGICLDGEPSNGATKINNTCVPTNHTTETFKSSDEEEKKILRITECGCKPAE